MSLITNSGMEQLRKYQTKVIVVATLPEDDVIAAMAG
jgi:hypothetical protein